MQTLSTKRDVHECSVIAKLPQASVQQTTRVRPRCKNGAASPVQQLLSVEHAVFEAAGHLQNRSAAAAADDRMRMRHTGAGRASPKALLLHQMAFIVEDCRTADRGEGRGRGVKEIEELRHDGAYV